jgi:hypothetical protein
MKWERADQATIDESAFYVVQTNGGEWRDFDLFILKGIMVAYRMNPSYVRGRPVWIAKITKPESDSNVS